MTDMLVKLYQLPPLAPLIESQAEKGIIVRRAIAPEKHLVIEWVHTHFNPHWVSECEAAYSNQPPSLFIATQQGRMIGFAAYDATAKNFFGPTGVDPEARGAGTGRALFLACLHAMRWDGYAYAIIGGVGPIEFYEKSVGATIIPDSTPGIYADMLRKKNP